MAKLVVLYKTPKDPAAFDAYYNATHIPIARKIPGLRKYEISTGPIGTPDGPSGLHLTAILTFDSLAAIKDALGSPEGQAAADDLANFASGGADLYMFDTKDA
ncbi:EthD family reductase [Arvimicrobium flavum]|uniref:EthD family reductase n=1 Tax=Arvimicrobium flavum TaxID=3393320 RepID=UPI00237BAA11|nr:EthD family reductase [Mesorhizobium shangrilense]